MEVVGSSTCDKSGSDRPMSWLLTNYHSTTERLFQTMPALENLRSQRAELGNNVKRLMNLVITPSSVPDFTIPQTYRSGSGSLQARQGSTDSLTSLVDYSPSASRVPKRRNSESSSGSNSPELSNNNNGSHPRQPRSQPASPKLLTPMKNKGLFRRSHTISYEMIDECREPATTNADPRSLAAMSLPHLKTKTKFGFETLSECPKTERRESLFHNQNYSLKNSNQAWKLSVLNGLSSKRCGNKQAETSSTDDSKASLEHLRRTRSKRRNVHSQVAPLGVAISPQDSLESNASSCGNSPIPSRTSSLDRNSPLASGLAEKRKRFSSKRSATVGQDGMKTILANNKQNPQTPNDSRRGSCLNNNISLNEEDVQQLLRLSAMTCTVQAGASNSFPGAMGSIGFEDQNRLAALVTSQKQVTRGELKFSLEYSQTKHQLRVHLQEGVSLSNGQLTGTEGINAFVKLSINTQRFTSNVIRNTNNPVFDKAFTFRDISPEQLCEHKLRIKVLHREGLLKRNELLGSLDVNLAMIINCSQPRLELRRELETEYIPRVSFSLEY